MKNPEYLFAFQKRLLSSAGATIVMTGDSTTAGTGVTADYVPNTLLSNLGSERGAFPLTVINRGQSGKHSGDWDTSFVSGDIANSPHLYIVRWGLNDAYIPYSRTLADFEASMRSALGKIRAVHSLTQASILIMSPNTANSDGRTPATIAPMAASLATIADEYQCAYFDTYDFIKTPNADWMDTILCHPANVMNAAIYGQVAELIFPKRSVQISEIALTGSWVNYDPLYYDVRAKRSGWDVHLYGVVKYGLTAQWSLMGALAAGFRPCQNQFFRVTTDTADATLLIMADGLIYIWTCPACSWISLDNISFHV